LLPWSAPNERPGGAGDQGLAGAGLVAKGVRMDKGMTMLTRAEIDERLAMLARVDTVYFGANMSINREREALETARQLAEWLEVTHYPSPFSNEPGYATWAEAHSEYVDWLEGCDE
jgi:hypothetical protein